VHFTNGYVSSVASLGLQSVYAATQQGVFVSVDDGQHWNAVSNAGLFYPHILSLTFDPRGVLYAGTYGGGVYRSAQTLAGAESPASVPLAYALGQNYPNPFNPETVIEFDVPAPGRGEVTLRVFDLLGREVATLLTGAAAGGAHRVSWNAAGLPAGVYFYRLQAGAFSATKKMLLLR